MIRIVADTNTVVSGLLWQGPPAQLIDAAINGLCEFLATEAMIDELIDVLSRRKFERRFTETGVDAPTLISRYRVLATFVLPGIITDSPLADRDDEIILACAVGGGADFIVSGDNHLLKLGQYRSIPVLRAGQMVEKLLG
jgi:putative PIN family toxin of toxin-antitoxin system